MAADTSEDGLLGGRVRLLQPRRGYRVAVDPVLLAAAVDARPGQRVLDLGSGAGAVTFCLAARVPDLEMVGIELQPEFVALAERSAVLNKNVNVRFVQHDIAKPLPSGLAPFDHVATNPPYLAAAVADLPPDKGKALANVESSADLVRWLAVATGALKPDGTLTLIHRLDRLDEIGDTLWQLGWGDIALKKLQPSRVLVRARRSATPIRFDSPPLELHGAKGGYTEAAEAILRHVAPLAF
jgi:tRNA1(Val) A37 N6-methylase TrmN6